MGTAVVTKQYLDDNGNPVSSSTGLSPAKTYLDDDGNPIKASAAPAQPQPEARTFGNYASEIARGVGRGVVNDVTGIAQTVMHPIDTATGLLEQANESGEAAGKEFRDLKGVPIGQRLGATALAGLEKAPIIGGMVQHAELGGERMGSPEAAGAAAEGITTMAAPSAVAKFVGPLTSKLTGSASGAMGDLVAKTKASNAAADAHMRVQSAIETARNNALKEGNAKYTTVNDALNPIPAKMGDIQDGLHESLSKISGTPNTPAILNSIAERIKTGHELNYGDLHGYYSELGKELSKGTLPGDQYQAYSTMHEAIGNDMQRIADSQGMGEQLTGARNYWRRMHQAFNRGYNPTDVASGLLKSTSPELAEKAATANKVRLLGSFDPEIPKAVSDLQGATEAAKGGPQTVPGETTQIGPDDIRAAKTEALQGKADATRNLGRRMASYGVGLKALWDTFHGNLDGVASDVAIGVAGYKLADLMAKALENPSVVKFFTNPTDADIAQIPPEMRINLPKIIHAAQSKGINVSPKLVAAVTAAGFVGPKTKKLQEMTGANFVDTGTDNGVPAH